MLGKKFPSSTTTNLINSYSSIGAPRKLMQLLCCLISTQISLKAKGTQNIAPLPSTPTYTERARAGNMRTWDPWPNSLLTKKRLSSCLDKWKSLDRHHSWVGQQSFLACQQQEVSAMEYQNLLYEMGASHSWNDQDKREQHVENFCTSHTGVRLIVQENHS